MTDREKDIFLVTKLGQCIRFDENDVRPTGRTSMGVIGMNLSYDDEVIGMQLNTQGEYLLLVSEYGLGKRTKIDEFSVQRRGGKGVKCYKITDKTGNVVGVKAVNEENEIMMITTEGILIRIQCSQISEIGRITSGVILMNIDQSKSIKIASIAKVRESEADISEEDLEEILDDEVEQKTEIEKEDTIEE